MKEPKILQEKLDWLDLQLTRAKLRDDKELVRLYDELALLLQWVIQ